MKKLNFVFLLLLFTSNIRAQESIEDFPIIYEKNEIKVREVEESNEYKKAEISLSNFVQKPESEDLLVTFDISNYELKRSSNNNISGLCASSGKGQHIHFIVDNKPYNALYDNFHKWSEEDGQHMLLAFLSRAHHQSIKTENSYVLKAFNLGKKKRLLNVDKPYLFYSRPKGTYVDGDAENIMLDFFIVNCKLSPKGYKVRATIDNAYTFYIYKWTPHIIQGLNLGKHRIMLTLLDENNRPVKNKFNPVVREIILMNNPE